MNPEVVVVSTAFNPNPEHRRNCELSVLSQTVCAQHVYIDAAKEGGAATENLYNVVTNLDPFAIVVWLDGDDWFAHDHAIERVVKEYHRGAWLTWGQFRYASGAPGWSKEALVGVPPRQQTWFASHLKTFRAGLFHKIFQADLQKSTGRKIADPVLGHHPERSWVTLAVDQVVMFPMLEMAAERGHFIPEILHVYSGENSTPEQVAAGVNESKRIRSMNPYKRLEIQPW